MDKIERASNWTSWLEGITRIIVLWVMCVIYCLFMPILFLIPVFITFLYIFTLVRRQKAVNTGNNIAHWGIVTLSLVSIIGGILTLFLERGRPTSNLNKQTNPSAIKKTYDEPAFIFVEPSPFNEIKLEGLVKVVTGFYDSSINLRLFDNDIGRVISIDGDNLTIAIGRSGSIFNVKVKRDNVLVRIPNPKLVQNQRTMETANNSVSFNKKDNVDKFEEIKKYKELLDLNIISKEEFDKKKEELFG